MTRTQNTPTPAVDLLPGVGGPTAGEEATLTGRSPAVVVDLTLTGHPSASSTASTLQAIVSEIGRYRVERVLGEGGFGVVYLAHDDQLKRRVAIKVPQPRVIRCPEDAEQYLVEAQVVARLEHPFIVPVYDVGRTAEGLPFIVSRYIEGCNLAERIRQSRLSLRDSVQLVVRMAEALGFAHENKLVHRDVKPGNILMEDGSKPFLVDFGLALREEDIGKGSGGGTPAYMSPEQANGEGHLVDGRSDIYSLGVILYELLSGERPHKAKTLQELLRQIVETDPRLPRQLDETIPPELERITLKALAKRASDRYATANELAEDLRHWLNPEANATNRESATAKIVPKGLRSFDAGDTHFFLELLPGPRDRDGLPESLRFWKTRIEEPDPSKTFRVGVIYGPSGCGKSSFVKAGLLPRLAEKVRVVYIEATPDETESRLLRGLERACPDLPRGGSLRDAIIFLRRREDANRKVVLIIDQFEQWLHSGNRGEHAGLVHDLRHCDGEHVQCIVMVRDDFWMPLSRFMDKMEVRILGGHNSAAIDLFDPAHARKVLSAFGRAYGTLPADGMPSSEQEAFLAQAVEGLAQEEKVISVRVALFAEMMKGRAWTPATLAQVGGTEGIGVTFLEETFSSRTAPPEHRHHQEAARGVLRVLLPGSGTDIKGHMRSLTELREAAGYGESPKEFDDLLSILDGELRLITPTDAGGVESAPSAERYYQLTHDFLVPSLRDWLTRKQKETPRGRAELLLEDRAGVWNSRPENRQLPTLFQWIRIRRMIPKKLWTAPQAKMMAKAARLHASRSVSLAGLLAVLTVAGLAIRDRVEEKRKSTQAEGLVQAVLDADTALAPGIIARISEFRKWADPLLKDEAAKATANSKQKLHASLALLPVDDTQVDFLYGRLLDAAPQDVPVIRDALAPHKDGLLEKLWSVVEKPVKGQESQRLRAAAALTKYDPESERWAKAGTAVVNDLVLENPVFLGHWSGAFFDVRSRLVQRLSEIYRDQQPERSAERSLATNLLANYAAENSQTLADLLMDADAKQFAVVYPKLKDLREQGLPILLAEIAKLLPKEMPSSDDRREILAKRQANAAVALIRLNKPETVWPLLKHSPDPRVRSYIIHKLSPLGVNAEAILKQLDEEKEITIRRALLLSLGEFSETELTLADRQTFLPKLQEMYRMSPDPGLHAAAEWLLRKWEEKKWLEPGWTRKVNDEWAKDGESRLKRLQEIKTSLSKDKEKASRQWYVNSQGQTMVVLPGPVKFNMGSPTAEKGRSENEAQHLMKIGRSFEIAAKSVTWEDYLKFAPGESSEREDRYSPTLDCPANYISWFMAAKYCNWLSKAEGIPMKQWCYETDSKGEVTKLKENYLSLSGYRLPTEAEMEYVIRAESRTARYYGEADLLLEKYAWYQKNSDEKSWPVGVKKPNDFGLFDVQGNSYSWCQEQYAPYPNLEGKLDTEDNEVKQLQISQESRVLRGGSFDDRASNARSANRSNNGPAYRNYYIGFRPARTFIP